tara:strand:+ start:394 stop:582 length:189 start_codon:yes stop_codon:yes gene_type:complete
MLFLDYLVPVLVPYFYAIPTHAGQDFLNLVCEPQCPTTGAVGSSTSWLTTLFTFSTHWHALM